MLIRKFPAFLLVAVFVSSQPSTRSTAQSGSQSTPFGFTDFSKEAATETKFLDVPDAKLAGEELKTLTAEPHLAATPEDHKTAEYVAEKFLCANLECPSYHTIHSHLFNINPNFPHIAIEPARYEEIVADGILYE